MGLLKKVIIYRSPLRYPPVFKTENLLACYVRYFSGPLLLRSLSIFYINCLFVFFISHLTGPVKTTEAPKQQAKLLFQESLEGSVLVQLSAESGVTLQWRRTPQETLALLREIGNNYTGAKAT